VISLPQISPPKPCVHLSFPATSTCPAHSNVVDNIKMCPKFVAFGVCGQDLFRSGRVSVADCCKCDNEFSYSTKSTIFWLAEQVLVSEAELSL
jgi:hypothetical protein